MRTQQMPQRASQARQAEAVAAPEAAPLRAPRARRAAAPAIAAAAPSIQARVRALSLEEGLYAVSVGALSAPPGDAGGIALPAVQVSAPPVEGGATVEIGFGSGDANGWLGAAGGMVVARVGPGGGALLVTAFTAADSTDEPAIDVRRLDRSRVAAVPVAAPPPARAELRREIVLHIEREGDRRFNDPGWTGHRGGRVRVEAFSIRPLEMLSPGDIEYKAFGPGGRETPWVSDGKLCGTRGLGLPLTGFAVRPAPRLADRFEAVYAGSFFAGGVTGPLRNGEPCRSNVPDDPLDAILVRLAERGRA